jgi:ABC-type multidrug transport system ATPase subunit
VRPTAAGADVANGFVMSHIVIVIGGPGAGKSSLCRALAQRSPRRAMQAQIERMRLRNGPFDEQLIAAISEPFFVPLMEAVDTLTSPRGSETVDVRVTTPAGTSGR